MPPSIRFRSIALVLVAAMVAIAAIATLSPARALSRAEAAGEQDCADLYLIAARGSGQDAGLPPEINALAYPIIEQSSRQLKVRLVSVDYAAASIDLLFAGDYAQEQYMRSMISGAGAMKMEYEHIEALCGETAPKYVFAGYSQGAYAVREMLDSIQTEDRERAVFIMVGDPLRTPKETRTHTGTAKPSSGILSLAIQNFSPGSPVGTITGSSAARTKSHCNAGDAVCATYRGLVKNEKIPGIMGVSIKVHLAYEEDPAMADLASWAVDTLGLAGPPVSITTTTLPDAYPNEPYYAQLMADGGTPPYTWSLTGGTLPTGISLSDAGTLTGIPTGDGSYEPAFRVSDSAGNTATLTLPLVVSAGKDPRSGTPAESIAAGTDHSCAVTVAGATKCWGFGILGDGGSKDEARYTPVDIVGLGPSTTSTVAVSRGHSCAVTVDGAVKCWGYNGAGGLGDGTTMDRLTPVDVIGLGPGTTSTVSVGFGYSCALTVDGAVKCWGRGGLLGDGTWTTRLTPVDVVGLGPGTTTTVTTGDDHSCAVTVDNSVRCWGAGGPSNGSADGDGLTPVDVAGLGPGTTTTATTGEDHSCAVTVDGAVKCWGHNQAGALGDGTTMDRLTPVDVIGLGPGTTSTVVGGGSHSCAVTLDGAVKCWGYNGGGALGDGTRMDRLTAVDVVGLGPGTTSMVVAGTYHSCAVTVDGTAKCWGSSFLGDGDGYSPGYDGYPVDVVGLHP